MKHHFVMLTLWAENNNNNSNNAFYLLFPLVLHKNIATGENGGITQNKTSAMWKNSEIWNWCPSPEYLMKTRSLKQLHGEDLRLAFMGSELFLPSNAACSETPLW